MVVRRDGDGKLRLVFRTRLLRSRRETRYTVRRATKSGLFTLRPTTIDDAIGTNTAGRRGNNGQSKRLFFIYRLRARTKRPFLPDFVFNIATPVTNKRARRTAHVADISKRK